MKKFLSLLSLILTLVFIFCSCERGGIMVDASKQEWNNQELAQKAGDILKKIDNASWFGWDDFECLLAGKIAEAYKSTPDADGVPMEKLKNAVCDSMDKYRAEAAAENTGLTEAQVKYVIESAISGSACDVSEAQIKSMLDVVALGSFGLPELDEAQISSIYEAARSKLNTVQTADIVTSAIWAAAADSSKQYDSDGVTQKIVSAIKAAKKNAGLLTDAQVSEILSSIETET